MKTMMLDIGDGDSMRFPCPVMRVTWERCDDGETGACMLDEFIDQNRDSLSAVDVDRLIELKAGHVTIMGGACVVGRAS